MRTFLASALLTLITAPAAAADWRVVLTDEEEDFGRSVAFVDARTVERTGDDIRFRVDIRIERPPITADGLRGRVRADCRTYSFETSDMSYYVAERLLRAAPAEPAHQAAAGEHMFVLLENLCGGRFLSGSVDPVAYARAFFGRE